MAEPQPERPDPLELAVDQAIAVCDGDVRAALRAALFYNTFLERKLETMRGMVSSGYSRGKISPTRKASNTMEAWREISAIVAANDPFCHGVVLLGLDASEDRVAQSFEIAARHVVCRGFAIGRTIFGAPARDWFAGNIDDATAVTRRPCTRNRRMMLVRAAPRASRKPTSRRRRLTT